MSESVFNRAALIDLIGELGREIFYLIDDCLESGPIGQTTLTVTEDGVAKVSAILDRIDELPFEEEGYVLGTGAKLQAAMRATTTVPTDAAPFMDKLAELSGIMHDLMCLPDSASIAVAREWAKAAQEKIAVLRATT